MALEEKKSGPKVKQTIAEKCPVCGGMINCQYCGDLGAVDHYYTWEHTCQNCGYNEEFFIFGCGGQEREDDPANHYESGKEGGCPGPH